MINKYKRFNFLIVILTCIGLAVFFVLKALEERIVFFYSPTEIFQKEIEPNHVIRIGGLVLDNSINYENNGLVVKFSITDSKNTINVNYEGILPDLFREGQGVVAEGKLDKEHKIFYAKKILAKHDENYMPPEIKKIISN